MANQSSQKNYYDVLGISKDAQEQDIKDAYRKLVSYWHPDLRAHDKDLSERNLKLINEAYSHLKTSQKRAHYDRILLLQSKAAQMPRRNGQTAQSAWNKFWHWLVMNESNGK